MNCPRDKPVSRARFLSQCQDASLPAPLPPFHEILPPGGVSPESRQPLKLDHYLMNSQHTTIAVFAGRPLIIRTSDIAPRGIKILTSSLTRARGCSHEIDSSPPSGTTPRFRELMGRFGDGHGILLETPIEGARGSVQIREITLSHSRASLLER